MRPARPLAVAVVLLAACGARTSLRPLLKEYRVHTPRTQVVQPVWLAAFTTDEIHGRLAPDGRQLVYAGNQKGNLDIWVKDLTTGIPKRLTSHVATDTQPCWSPDGKKVAFVSMRRDVKGDIYIWDDGKLTQLTDRTTADAYPVFSPDGKSLYLAAGPEGLSRIDRIDLASNKRTAMSDWDATHPAISPDGRLLAFTQFDGNRRGRIALLELSSRKLHVVTTPDYQAGFPAFSPDGRRLAFSRFTSGSPDRPLTDRTSSASLWALDVGRALSARSPEEADALGRPLTSGRQTVLLVQDSGRGLVFTTSRAGSLDVGLLPEQGLFPRLGSAARQLQLALAQENPRDRLMGLTLVVLMGRSAEASRALYLSSALHRELGEYSQARTILERLRSESPMTHGDVAYLAEIDLPLLDVEQAHGQGAVAFPTVQRALDRLRSIRLPDSPSSRVAAHLLLRRGDVQRMAGRVEAAIAAYESVVQHHLDVRDHAVEAQFRLGGLFGQVRTPDLLATYFLSLFRTFPEQTEWLRRVARAVLEIFDTLTPAAEVEKLRALIDRHREHPLFCAIAEMRVARLHEQMENLDLAIAAMASVTRNYPAKQLLRERTSAAFELGRLCLANYERLRQKGRLSEALSFYDKALGAYAHMLKTYEPGHENNTLARTEFLRLSLLMAAQLERDGEAALAQKRHRAILEVEPENLQAHRKLIQFGLRQGRGAELADRYRQRLSRNAADFIGHYALGYLATFSDGAHLSRADLDRAEKHLKRAVSLNPQSPFGHMTLGWVNEMRERHLGQQARGWLEEAIVLYDRAYSLNDARIDVQTEADLLINLCNSFANLGNGWKQAYEFCDKRHQLKIPFSSKERAVTFHLTFGRAASATGRYQVSNDQLEQALDLARDLRRPVLEAEAVARLALTAQLQREHERAARYFEQAIALCRKLARVDTLASLARSVAFNRARQGDRRGALQQLAEALRALRQHGTAPIDAHSPIEGVNCQALNCSTAPYGFDQVDESYIAKAIRQQILREQGALQEVGQLVQQRLASREQAKKVRKKEGRGPQDELDREPLLLRNELALTHLALGDSRAFARQLEQATAAVEKMQTDKKKGFIADPALFPAQTALQLNRAEHAVRRLALGLRVPLSELVPLLEQLERTDARRAELARTGNDPLPERLRLSLWSDLALLSFHVGLMRPVAPGSKGAKTPPRGERELTELLRRADPFVRAMRLARKIFNQTSPDLISEETDEARAIAATAARNRGTLEPLWRPLSRRERLRWHLLCGLNLAQMASAFTPRQTLEQHPSTELLQQLVALNLTHELGALRFALLAELAHRRQDLPAMEAAVRGFLQRSPLLLDAGYLQQAEQIRHLIFERAVGLALAADDVGRAVAWAEQQDRRAFLDELLRLPPAGWGRAAKPLAALLQASRQYREHLDREPGAPLLHLGAPRAGPGLTPASLPADAQASESLAPDPEREAWRARLHRLEQDVAKQLKVLESTAPRAAALLGPVPDFPEQRLMAALAPGDLALTAVVHQQTILLAAYAPGKKPAVERVPVDSRQRDRQLQQAVARLVKGAQRVYLDLGRIDPDIDPRRQLPASTPMVRLSTLWELVDAFDVRNLAFSGGLLLDTSAAAAGLARSLKLKAVVGEQLVLDRIDRRLERAGILIWTGAKRFDGGSAAALRLMMHDPDGTRLSDLLPGRSLGLPLRGHLLLLTDLRFTPGRERIERIALMRMAHAMGLPAVATMPRAAARPDRLGQLIAGLTRGDLVSAVKQLGPTASLYGHGGMAPAEARVFAKKMLDASARAGVVAFRKRQLVQAVEHLEATVRYMDYLQEFKYQDGALEFLAQAYTLLQDYARAVPLMTRLLAVRAKAIEETRASAPKKVLSAQAKWVKALTDMAWLRMRNKQYDKALEANAAAIQLYKEVKRPLLAQSSYVQRAIIAEKKGDNREALAQAHLALVTARTALAKAPTNAAARAKVSEAAERVARFQRMLFSNYRAAAAAAGVALDHIPQVKAAELAQLTAQAKALMEQKKTADKTADKAADKARPAALNKQLEAVLARRSTLAKALASRVQVILELARIQSARGDYGKAVKRAEEALSLCRDGGLAAQMEAAMLELVNNLYYTGAYAPALARSSEGLRLTKQPIRRIQFHNARGTVFASLGQTEEALKELRSALSIATRLGNPTEMAASHNNLGNALRLAGRFEQAKRAFALALELDRRQEDKLGMAFDHANLGLTLELMGRRRDARADLKRALDLSRQIGAPLNELKALAGLGRMSLADNGPQALALFRQGLAIADRLGLINWSWRFHLLEGQALRRLGQADRAKAALLAGLALIEHRPPRLRRALGAPRVEEEPEDLYDELIDLLAQQGEADAAFDLAERRRARAFVDLVSRNSQNLPIPQARKLVQQITSLQQELEAARAEQMRTVTSRALGPHSRAGSPASRAEARRELERVQQELEAARGALATLNPRLPELVLLDTWPLVRLPALLPRKALLLSYVPTRDRLVVFSLLRGKLSMKVVPVGRRQLTRAVLQYRRSLMRFHPTDELSRKLYDQLLAPVLGPDAPQRLVIVPGGPLHLLPFAALLRRDGSPLVEHHSVSYLTSVNALRGLAAPKERARSPHRVSFGWTGQAPRPLSFTVRESEAFTAAFAGAVSVQGPEATRARLLQEAPTADLLHIATHADFRADAPLDTALELADAELPLLDLMGLKLRPGALVILSACDTGVGPLDGADAVVGLNQAFIAAGARRVVSSLWRVSDLGAALTMKYLFRSLAGRSPPARALQQAQNQLRRRFPHPAFWAAFRIDGAP